MDIKKTTIQEFVNQVKDCTNVNVAILKAASQSTLNTVNNKDLKSVVTMWQEGWYDDSPADVIPQIKSILKVF